jgi:hypothetical protein
LLLVVAAFDQRGVDFRARLSNGLAVFERDDARDLFSRLFEQLQERSDELLTMGNGCASPGAECIRCGVNRAGDVVDGRRLKRSEVAAAMRGVLVTECRAASRRDPSAPDEVVVGSDMAGPFTSTRLE